MSENDVFINEHNIIEIIVCGDQTVASVQAMGDDAMKLARDYRRSGKRVLILDNLLEIGEVPSDAFKQVMDLIKSSEYDRFAMVGKGSAIRIGANLILKAIGRSKHVKYFDDMNAATAWLLED
jgi:UDP-N-acetylmuramyl pentapeptide synthase